MTSGEVKAPSVFIYGPSEEELKTDKATVVCAISAYTPRTVTVEWTVDGTKWTSGIQTSTESKQADNLYMKSSFFSLSTSEYNKHEEYGFGCSSLTRNYLQHIHQDGRLLYCCQALWAIFGEGTQLIVLTGEVKVPNVFIYGPSEEELKTDKATMVCAISAYTPRTVTVEWTVDGTKRTNGVQTSTESKQADNLYMKSSFFSLSTSEYNKHEEYGCKVTHQSKEIMQTFKRSECH
ncbi:immunoglobulin lambda-like polypeptide 1 [Phyllobates terribilis]|uniref:immunoglobulin lambda-like polypeptide 1 n=1 Tax=Phyllobates terribilis TaxID=111132 RepID=UPI003CCAC3AD